MGGREYSYEFSAVSEESGCLKVMVLHSWRLELCSKFYLDAPTVASERCKLSSAEVRRQFITLSVRQCVQHSRSDAASRAGPSATAEPCRRRVESGM